MANNCNVTEAEGDDQVSVSKSESKGGINPRKIDMLDSESLTLL